MLNDQNNFSHHQSKHFAHTLQERYTFCSAVSMSRPVRIPEGVVRHRYFGNHRLLNRHSPVRSRRVEHNNVIGSSCCDGGGGGGDSMPDIVKTSVFIMSQIPSKL